jgi:hypothetical protein
MGVMTLTSSGISTFWTPQNMLLIARLYLDA